MLHTFQNYITFISTLRQFIIRPYVCSFSSVSVMSWSVLVIMALRNSLNLVPVQLVHSLTSCICLKSLDVSFNWKKLKRYTVVYKKKIYEGCQRFKRTKAFLKDLYARVLLHIGTKSNFPSIYTRFFFFFQFQLFQLRPLSKANSMGNHPQ